MQQVPFENLLGQNLDLEIFLTLMCGVESGGFTPAYYGHAMGVHSEQSARLFRKVETLGLIERTGKFSRGLQWYRVGNRWSPQFRVTDAGLAFLTAIGNYHGELIRLGGDLLKTRTSESIANCI